MTRIKLWNGNTIPRLGMGCWAIGGHFWAGEQALGWGDVDDQESIAAIQCALELGIKCFDTADVYGCGHSESVVAQALGSSANDVLVSTKFGNRFDESTRQMSGIVDDPKGIRAATEASLRRLKRDRLDLVFFHINEHPIEVAEPVFETLAELRHEGKISAFGWSTDIPESAAHFAAMEGFSCIQHNMNLFQPATALLPVLNQYSLCSMARQPLAMGLLSGRFKFGQALFESSDIRAGGPQWQRYFIEGKPNENLLEALNSVRELLMSDGRTMAQGALAWIWAKSPNIIPIPGFRTVRQVEENVGALSKGPLAGNVVEEIDRIIQFETVHP